MPGSPWENGYIESFNGKVRDELLNREVFDSLLEARVLVARWPRAYNPIFPTGWIGLHSDPETLELGRRSFAEFRSYGQEGYTSWSEGRQTCLAARLGLGAEAEARLETDGGSQVLSGDILEWQAQAGACYRLTAV
jgi:hypothetical protein